MDNHTQDFDNLFEMIKSSDPLKLFKLEGSKKWYIIRFHKRSRNFRIISASTTTFDFIDSCYALFYSGVDADLEIPIKGQVQGIKFLYKKKNNEDDTVPWNSVSFHACSLKDCPGSCNRSIANFSLRLTGISVEELPMYMANSTSHFRILLKGQE